MRVLLGQAGSITIIAMVIAITWIGRVMVESEVIKEGTTRMIENEIILIMRMNGCQQEKEKGNRVELLSLTRVGQVRVSI
jgi:hypothetical protein